MKILNDRIILTAIHFFFFVSFFTFASHAQMHLLQTIQHVPDPIWLEPPAPLEPSIYTYALTKDSRMIATSGTSSDIRIWDVESGNILTSIDNLGSMNNPLAFTPGMTRIAAGQSGGIVKVFDLLTKEVIFTFTQEPKPLETTHVIDIAISPDSKKLIMRVGGSASMWSLVTGEQLAYFEDIRGGDIDRFLSDNIHLFMKTGSQATLFNTQTGEESRIYELLYPDLLYDEKRIVFFEGEVINPGRSDATYTRRYKILDIETEEVVYESEKFDFIPETIIRFSPSGETFAHFNPEAESKETSLYQLASSTKARIFQTSEIDYFDRFEFSPDGRKLITTKDDRLFIWDISDLDSKIQNSRMYSN